LLPFKQVNPLLPLSRFENDKSEMASKGWPLNCQEMQVKNANLD
jgi:hypothetical protein